MELILRLSERISYLLDGAILITLGIAAIIGLFRPWRKTGMQLIIKVVSIIFAIIGGRMLSGRFGPQLANRVNVSILLPEEILSLGEMYTELIITAIIFFIVAIVIYSFVGSILVTFNKTFDWDAKLLENRSIPGPVGKLLGVLLSVLNVYPYLLIGIIALSFPLFGIVHEGKLSYVLLNGTPLVSSQVARFNQPFTHLQVVIDLIEDDIQNIVTNGQVDFESVADMINEDPARAQELRGAVVDMFPELPADYVQIMDDIISQGEITPAEIEAKLAEMGGLDRILEHLN